MSDPEIIEVEKRVPVQVPAHLLVKCRKSDLPQIGQDWTWLEIFELMKRKDAEQDACNERFGIIKDWQSGEP